MKHLLCMFDINLTELLGGFNKENILLFYSWEINKKSLIPYFFAQGL